MAILLIGLPYSGKTTLGKKLAERLSAPFIDSDRLIEERAGMSCRALFLESEKRFREIEKEVLLSLAPPENGVVALGGGAILHEEIFDFLKSLGTIVYLYEEPLVVFERMERGGFPATLDPKNPFLSWMELLEKRLVMYHYLSDLTVYGEQQFWDLFSNHHLRGIARPCCRGSD